MTSNSNDSYTCDENSTSTRTSNKNMEIEAHQFPGMHLPQHTNGSSDLTGMPGDSRDPTAFSNLNGALHEQHGINGNKYDMQQWNGNSGHQRRHSHGHGLHQCQQQQQQRQSHRPQQSPTFHSRSSPIAIIRNPEDEQAKLRWQHPIYYDTSDDEFDEYDSNHRGIVSVESLTSLPSSTPSGPQSLPTALLRAPKLGSLPAQDYRLLHLATLPPPMCLNSSDGGEFCDTPVAATTPTTTSVKDCNNQDNNGQEQSHLAPPIFLSSYGSLRESHLTGRFGGGSSMSYHNHHNTTGNDTGSNRNLNAKKYNQAASTGNLSTAGRRKVRFLHDHDHDTEPPATLSNSKTATSFLERSNTGDGQLQPRSKQLPKTKSKPLSIRDRMMQKAQQQKESTASPSTDSSSKSVEGGESKNTSSLSAMLEASQRQQQQQLNTSSQTNNNDIGHTVFGVGDRCPLAPAAQTPAANANRILPQSMAQAVAISYNSNLSLFAMVQREREEVEAERQQNASNRMLSSSMTGLEVLRAASKSRPARPTSLSILQDARSSSSLNMRTSSPPATTATTTTSCGSGKTLLIIGDSTSTTASVCSSDHYARPLAPLARTMSDPTPAQQQYPQVQQNQPQTLPPVKTEITSRSASESTASSFAQLHSRRHEHQYQPTGVVHAAGGRTLLPPESLSLAVGPQQEPTTRPMTGLSTLMEQHQSHDALARQQDDTLRDTTTTPAGNNSVFISRTAWNVAAGDTTVLGNPVAFGVANGPHRPDSIPEDEKEPNPDTEGAFDMDMD